MSWVKLDDGFPTHRKTRKAGVDGVAFYTSALCYCARHLTDGVVPKDDLESVWPWGGMKLEAVARKLVAAGLFRETDESFVVNDYLSYNPSKAKVVEEREKGKARAAASYEKRSSKQENGSSSCEETAKKARTAGEESANSGRSTPEERAKISEEGEGSFVSSPDPSRPTPVPLPSPERENARAQTGLDSAEAKAARATTALRVAFARRYEQVRKMEWNRAGDPAVEKLGGWLSRNVTDVELALTTLLDRFFADPYAVKNDFPIGLLDKQAARLLEPPKGPRDVRKGFCEPSPASAFKNPTDLDKVFGPETPAAGGASR